MRFPKQKLLALVSTLLFICTPASEFSFVALGDTAYQGEESIEAYHRLIELINADDPVFSVHVGDIWGASVCVEERYEEILNTFNQYTHPLIFTPGDNEWTDCDRHAYGDWETTSRLDLVRQIYFSNNKSLGQNPLTVVRQSDVSDYSSYVENARWLHEDVLFVTLNISGSNNNLNIAQMNTLKEAHSRNKANIAWLRDSFRIAIEQDYSAVALFFHAELFAGTGGSRVPSAYSGIVNEMRMAALLFDKPVLLVHGDQHRFIIDRPLTGPGLSGEVNVVRLQVYGDPEVRAVKVIVDTNSPWVFSYQPLYLE